MPVAMTLSRAGALGRGQDSLASRVEAELLLCHLLGCTRAELYLDSGNSVDGSDLAIFDDMLQRRRSGEPIQYITGVQAFRKLELRVGPGVMVPRPETELLVEQCLILLAEVRNPRVIDLGTGSGAIALSAATERPGSRVWATDISEDALSWARTNLLAAGARNLELHSGDLFSPLPKELMGTIDLVVSNPPYLSEKELGEAPEDVRDHEPAVALSCGREGFEVSARIIDEAGAWMASGGWLVLEISPAQERAVTEMFSRDFEEVDIVNDLAGSARIARGRRR
ncbi:MAG: peptide chain release factor N(5)-glutamine methyltransferase [Actinomycetota bacterium]